MCLSEEKKMSQENEKCLSEEEWSEPIEFVESLSGGGSLSYEELREFNDRIDRESDPAGLKRF